jgi:catechol-2,3-dioxygenase
MKTQSRRTFLTRTAQVWAAMHLPMIQAAGQESAPKPDSSAPVRFDEIELETADPERLRDFYRDVIGLPIVDESAHRLSMRAGASRLTFMQTTSVSLEPFYHFAFNIPENQLNEAKAWLESRVPLLAIKGTRQTTIEFKAWNAHAIYFHDPAGNIVEFIARHDLPNASPRSFSVDQLLNVSEIGLVTRNVPALSKKLRESLNLSVYKQATPTFAPVGNEHGLFILAKAGRPWFPERTQTAETCPVNITMGGSHRRTLNLAPLPFRVEPSKNA